MNMSERHQKAKSILISPSEAISKSQVRTTSRSEAFLKGKARSHLSKRSITEGRSPFPPLEAKRSQRAKPVPASRSEAFLKGKTRSHMSDTKTPRKCEAFSKALS
ncbi:hypothetical protein [Vibrio owensii]|uniref:hypothetical protein n=1 Tax=Vibrio owensii TaxID=696485 RepID=UPI003DA0C615